MDNTSKGAMTFGISRIFLLLINPYGEILLVIPLKKKAKLGT